MKLNALKTDSYGVKISAVVTAVLGGLLFLFDRLKKSDMVEEATTSIFNIFV